MCDEGETKYDRSRHDAAVQRIYGAATALGFSCRYEVSLPGAGRADIVVYRAVDRTPLYVVEVKADLPTEGTIDHAVSQVRRYWKALPSAEPWVVAFSILRQADIVRRPIRSVHVDTVNGFVDVLRRASGWVPTKAVA